MLGQLVWMIVDVEVTSVSQEGRAPKEEGSVLCADPTSHSRAVPPPASVSLVPGNWQQCPHDCPVTVLCCCSAPPPPCDSELRGHCAPAGTVGAHVPLDVRPLQTQAELC